MTHSFLIADWQINICFTNEDSLTGIHLIPSFEPFRINANEDVHDNQLFTLTVDSSIRSVDKEHRDHIRTFDTGNGDIVVDLLDTGGYQYIIRNIAGNDCALLITNASFTKCKCALAGTEDNRRYGLNNALMLAFAFAGGNHDTLLIHASLVRHRGVAYAFTAASGTGKSTQVANWLRIIPDCDLMNDDNPVIRVFKDDSSTNSNSSSRIIIYGSPWSGKTPCYRSVSAPLGSVIQIVRAPKNSMERLSPLSAFITLLPACSSMKWHETLYSHICDTVTDVVSNIPLYNLHCTADPESASVCHNVLTNEH